MTAKLTGECECGGTIDSPRRDCGRCELVRLATQALHEVFESRRRRVDDRDVVTGMADDFGLDAADLAFAVGRPELAP